MNKRQVMNKLHERDYLDELHRQIKEGLIGTLRNEYILQKPMREPYEKYVSEAKQLLSLPIFHAMVDMMTANLLNVVSEKLVHEVLEAMNELEKDLTTANG